MEKDGKNGSNKIYTTNKILYVEYIRKLLKDYNKTNDSAASFDTSFN